MKDLNLIAEPTEEELRQVIRELKFVEASNENPQFLSPSQIEKYNEQGYLMPFDGLSSSEISDLRNFLIEFWPKHWLREKTVIPSARPILNSA